MSHLHLHLDPLGGVAGDMFVAALLDSFPQHSAAVIAAAEAVSGVPCRLAAHRDEVMTGSRFVVTEPGHPHADTHREHHHQGGDHDAAHGHVTWRTIRARLDAASLPQGVRDHAIGIFTQLAIAEGRVHGVPEEAVTFHEVGATDSLADIVAAAWLIDAMGEASWSIGSLPLGSGRVLTAHGPMPVPAPATTLLLEGFTCIDDGIAGERVTPTGAAILRHLGCASRRGLSGRLLATGHGFGARRLPGLSNVLRLLVFATAEHAPAPAAAHRELAVIGFEVDDQSGEDLAAGLDRLRGLAGVHDVLQLPVFGKKSRLAVHVQVLAAPERLDAVIDACFAETTTIGLRTHLVQGRALRRTLHEVEVEGARLRVKAVERPGGPTAKTESDDALHLAGHAARARLRRRAEAMTAGAMTAGAMTAEADND